MGDGQARKSHGRESELKCKPENQDQSKGQTQGQKQYTKIIVNCQLFWTALNGTEI